MTGLDPAFDEIVEIACIVTEADLTELDAGISLVVKPTDAPLAAMDPFVVNMHTESGLIEEIPARHHAGRRRGPGARVRPVARPRGAQGSPGRLQRLRRPRLPGSVHAGDLDQHLHYRLIDVSSIKEIARRWYPRVYFATPEKNGNHRALGDIRESIAELRYYRDAAFVPAPRARLRYRRGPRRGARRRHSTSRPGREQTSRLLASPPPAGSDGHPEGFDRIVAPASGRDDRTEPTAPRAHGGCSSAGRAPGCGPGGRGFKSRHSPHVKGFITLFVSLARCGGLSPGPSRLPTSRHPLRTPTSRLRESRHAPRHPQWSTRVPFAGRHT